MEHEVPVYEVFLPQTREDYQRVGESVFHIAGLLSRPTDLLPQLVDERTVQWQHQKPQTVCRVTRINPELFTFDAIAMPARLRTSYVNSWMFGHQVGLIRLVEDRVPNELMEDPPRAVEYVREHYDLVSGKKTQFRLERGDSRDKFVREIMSFTLGKIVKQ